MRYVKFCFGVRVRDLLQFREGFKIEFQEDEDASEEFIF